nr:hypothetical protein [Paenibacillus campinasensis]
MMKTWKRMTLAAIVGVTAWGSVLAGTGLESVSAAPNAVPSYEVKFSARPEAVLTPDRQVRPEVIQQLGVSSTPLAIGVAYFDTDGLALNEQGWNVRFRKKADKNNYELTFKKRYPIINGDIDAALTLANKEGFDSSDDNYEAEIDWGYSRQTLSFSNEKKVSVNMAGPQLPSEQVMLSHLLDKLPGKLNKWSAPNWGKQMLSQSRSYGPVVFDRYEGQWQGVKMTLEVWPIRNSSGTGTEDFIEVSFKTADRNVATRLRAELLELLESNGWLLPGDDLKTQLILERY